MKRKQILGEELTVSALSPSSPAYKAEIPGESKALAIHVSDWHQVLLGRKGQENYEEEGERTISQMVAVVRGQGYN